MPIAIVVVMVLAAIATALMTGSVPPDIKRRLGDSFAGVIAVVAVLFGLGLTLYIRHLVLKTMSSAASKAWSAIRDGTAQGRPKSPWLNASDRAAPTETPLQPGQAKAPPKLFGTIFGFFLVMWFVTPLWSGLLRGFGLHKMPLVSWLPLIGFGLWALRRHADKT